jgi:hypothetical protein
MHATIVAKSVYIIFLQTFKHDYKNKFLGALYKKNFEKYKKCVKMSFFIVQDTRVDRTRT